MPSETSIDMSEHCCDTAGAGWQEELFLTEAKTGQFLAYSSAHTRSDMTVSDFQLENNHPLLLLSKWQAIGLLTLFRQIRIVCQITNQDLTGHTVICK